MRTEKPLPLTDERILFLLLQHGPLQRAQLRAITGWRERRLDKAIQSGTRPRGSIARELGVPSRHGWPYRAKTDDELRRLPPRKRRSARLPAVQPGLRDLRGSTAVGSAAHAHPAGAKARAVAREPGRLGGAWPLGAGVARAGGTGLGGLGS